MKSRFTNVDVFAIVNDLQGLIGMRVNNVYDIDHKTYLIRFVKSDFKAMLLFESGVRIHTTEFGWSKNILPSSFSMKLRKHLRQKRLEAVKQVDHDRIIDFEFGSGEFTHHVIVELYDRGNVVLTDREYMILNILRPRTDKDTDVRYAVRQCYFPEGRKRDSTPFVACKIDSDYVRELISNCNAKENLQKVLASKYPYGSALLEHCCRKENVSFKWTAKKVLEQENGMDGLLRALQASQALYEQLRTEPCKGYITFRQERNSAGETIEMYVDFHPFLFAQLNQATVKEFATFNAAVDEFFSKLETQRLDQKQLQQERAAIRKLDNIRKDHDERLAKLQEAQQLSELKAVAVELNNQVVDRAILIIRDAIANQFEWAEIEETIEEAASLGDPVASKIVKLDLQKNHFVMRLSPDVESPVDAKAVVNDQEYDEEDELENKRTVDVEIDISLNAFRNARRLFDLKKQSALKEAKTLEASEKALRSAQLKTQQELKNVRQKTNVGKIRKTFWFEKFFWFISSDRLLIIGGRDAQQNELIVKRYLKPGDIYVHADIRGATSVIVKHEGIDPSTKHGTIPPKTLTEAATMAVCFSAAWDAKVVSNAWWVYHDQVSKRAPAGEYLTTGSFMIRGKKNYIAPSQLLLGFGVMFRLDEDTARQYLENLALEKQEEADKADELDQENVEQHVGISRLDDSEERKNEDEFSFPDVKVDLKFLEPSTEEAELTSIVPPMDSRKAPKQVQVQPAAIRRKERKKLRKAKALANKKGSTVPAANEAGAMEEQPDNVDVVAAGELAGKPELTVKDDEEITIEKGEDLQSVPDEEHAADEEPEDVSAFAEETLNAVQCLVGNLQSNYVPLYALPVCGPYSAMSNFTYKVKLTPGTTKKSSAVKTALHLFLQDKTVGGVSKDLLKVMREQDMSRNIPGKVKVSAPHLSSAKKR
uniref:NFACT RNA-binding domain-containing protein n=1 Tax=Trichuris muris TaxID=70415 RepID=A0A5S6R0C6_TRIMR